TSDLIGAPEPLIEELRYPFFEPAITQLRLFAELRARLSQDDWQATPLRKLFEIDAPFVLPEEARFSGHWILSPPGRGKTTLLHAMVMEDIRRPKASLILMEQRRSDRSDPQAEEPPGPIDHHRPGPAEPCRDQSAGHR